MQSKSSFEVPLPTCTLWGKPASMWQPLVCLHLVATARHCRFSCAGNRHLCWRAALIQASPKTTPTPALPWSDPQAASAATATQINSRIVSKASTNHVHTLSQLKTKNGNLRPFYFSLQSLPCTQTFALSLPHAQPDSMEKNCQMDNRGQFQCVCHTNGMTGCVWQEFQQWRRFTNLIAYGSSILGGSKRWLLHSFTLSTTLLLNKCTSFSYLGKQKTILMH